VEAAALLAERIRAAVRALEIEHAGAADGFVTLSAGVDALRPEAGSVQPKELVRGADKALYVAKSGGRNRVCTNETPVT
ncbi:diguanylate cyclase, partial [Variovorax paradoxus]|uniref:diguanylate cyclase n=1 Tax=Variovorax paradoxus TaxID=34073 RepID=UPI001ABBEC37